MGASGSKFKGRALAVVQGHEQGSTTPASCRLVPLVVLFRGRSLKFPRPSVLNFLVRHEQPPGLALLLLLAPGWL